MYISTTIENNHKELIGLCKIESDMLIFQRTVDWLVDCVGQYCLNLKDRESKTIQNTLQWGRY